MPVQTNSPSSHKPGQCSRSEPHHSGPKGPPKERLTTMLNGTVKWFNTQKGYGFVQPDAGGPDVFVHITAVQRAGLRELREGDKLTYELVTDRRTGKTSAGNLVLAG